MSSLFYNNQIADYWRVFRASVESVPQLEE
jgi:hypothetical protein